MNDDKHIDEYFEEGVEILGEEVEGFEHDACV